MKRSLFWSLLMGTAVVGLGLALLPERSSAFEPKNPALRLAVSGQADPIASAYDEASRGGLSIGPFHFTPEVQVEAPTALTDLRPDPLTFQADVGPGEERRDVQFEYALSAPARETGFGVDVALAPRAGFSVGPEGGGVRSVGGELRLGKRLKHMVSRYDGSDATFDRPAWYFFAATDGAALTWTPEAMAAGARKGVRYQEDRIVVGKAQVGLTMEAHGMQASVGYTNREVSNGKVSDDESFVGASFTMRH